MAADTIVGGMGQIVGIGAAPKRGMLYPSEAANTVPGGIATFGYQPPIGANTADTVTGGDGYVRDQLHPNGVTNAFGCNPEIAYDTDVMNEWSATVQFTCPSNSGAAPNGANKKDALWVKAGGTIAKGNRCAVASGVATADTAAGGYDAFTAAKVDQFLWVVTR